MLGTAFPLTVISKCRKWHLRGIYLEIFPRGTYPWTPLEDHAFSTGLAAPKTSLYLVARIGISGEVYSQSKLT